MAKKPYVTIDADILTSTIWREPPHVKVVWFTLLILCDLDGYVGASIPGIASTAGVTDEQCRDAMRRFQEPDPDSRTQSDEGRRIRVADRGFQIINFIEHLNRMSSERAKTRARVKKFRQRRAQMKRHETSVTLPSPPGNREEGRGNREVRTLPISPSAVVGGESRGEPAKNPLLRDRVKLEHQANELIRAIAAIETDRDPTEILLEASSWQDSAGNRRSKARVETMRDDHLIKTVADLKLILNRAEQRQREKIRR